MVIVKLAGGLGNQMFQYAAGKALAMKHNAELTMDISLLLDRKPRRDFTFRNYELDQFSCRTQYLQEGLYPALRGFSVSRFERMKYRITRVFDRELPMYHIESRWTFDAHFFQLPSHVYLEGYWQSEDYFQEFSDTIRKDFTFVGQPDITGRELIERISRCQSVCLHVRRGTYVTQPSENRFHGVCSLEYYTTAVKMMAQKVRGMMIFVFSDDPNWCKENLAFPYETVFVEIHYPGQNNGTYLKLMSCCKHFIISNSSFGWWGAWLAEHREKRVITPKQWYRDMEMDTSRLIPQGWIRI